MNLNSIPVEALYQATQVQDCGTSAQEQTGPTEQLNATQKT
jgi:hypothetical protein